MATFREKPECPLFFAVSNLQTTIVLIDGPQLAQLMLDHGVGIIEAGSFKVLKLNEDYFSED